MKFAKLKDTYFKEHLQLTASAACPTFAMGRTLDNGADTT